MYFKERLDCLLSLQHLLSLQLFAELEPGVQGSGAAAEADGQLEVVQEFNTALLTAKEGGREVLVNRIVALMRVSRRGDHGRSEMLDAGGWKGWQCTWLKYLPKQCSVCNDSMQQGHVLPCRSS